MSARQEKFKVTLNSKTCIQNTCGLSNNTEQTRRTLKNTYVSRVLWHVIGPFLSRVLQSGLKRKTNTTLFLLYRSKRHLDNPRKIVRFLTFLRCTERVCRRKNSLALEMASPSNAIRLLKSLRQYKIMMWLHWPSRDTPLDTFESCCLVDEKQRD